jgi:pSer/pThr/pTyr-binding forkhead associated (FHA) protein
MNRWFLKDVECEEIIPVENEEILGRTEGNHVFPDSPQMSRKHCQICIDDDYIYVKDLGSRNGTYVNSIKIDPNTKVRLTEGSTLMFGEKTFMLHKREYTLTIQYKKLG